MCEEHFVPVQRGSDFGASFVLHLFFIAARGWQRERKGVRGETKKNAMKSGFLKAREKL